MLSCFPFGHFHFHLFSRLLSRRLCRHVFSFIRWLGARSSPRATSSAVPVSRIQLSKKFLDTLVCKKTFKDYYLLSSFLQVLQGMFGKKCPTMYFDTDVCNYIVNYMYVKYIAMPIQLPIVESRSISRALLVQKCSTKKTTSVAAMTSASTWCSHIKL